MKWTQVDESSSCREVLQIDIVAWALLQLIVNVHVLQNIV